MRNCSFSKYGIIIWMTVVGVSSSKTFFVVSPSPGGVLVFLYSKFLTWMHMPKISCLLSKFGFLTTMEALYSFQAVMESCSASKITFMVENGNYILDFLSLILKCLYHLPTYSWLKGKYWEYNKSRHAVFACIVKLVFLARRVKKRKWGTEECWAGKNLKCAIS